HRVLGAGLDESGPLPAGARRIAVGPGVPLDTVELHPHRDGVARCIRRYLRRPSIPGAVGLDEFRRAPTRPRVMAIGPDVVADASALALYRDGLTAGVDGRMRNRGVARIVADRARGSPAGARRVAVGADVVPGSVELRPHGYGVARGVHHH